MTNRRPPDWAVATCAAVIPSVTVLNADGVAAAVGGVPVASVAAHTPISGIALAVVASPLSSRAVTSSVAVRPACAVKLDQAECPCAHITPVHHPPAVTGCGADSTPSPPALQLPPASPGAKRSEEPTS